MFEKFRKDKPDELQTKATDRLAYMQGTIPAWETASSSIRKSKTFSGFYDRFNGWVYASGQIIARACASQPIKLYSKKPRNGVKSLHPTQLCSEQKTAYLQGKLEGKPSTFVQRKAMQGDMVEVFSHPILDLLDNPSPEMDGYTLAIQRFLNLQITGNAYLHPILSETLGIPIELWNMQSDLVTIIPDGELDLVDYYTYGKMPSAVDFRKDEVLHEKQPNPTDAFYGRGWVSAALPAIDLLDSMDGYEQSVLDNQARPDWAIMVKEHLTDSQYQRLMQQVERQLGGNNNRSRPFIFEGGTDGKPMSFSPQDLAFASGENRKVEVIAAISGVPVSMLKANDPNLASAREGSLGFLRNTVKPYLTLDEAFLNRQLLPLFGEYADDLFLCYDDPVSVDKQLQSSIDATDASSGIRTRNEIRADRGLEPIEGGDELLVPAGSVPIDVAIEQARNPLPMFGSYGFGNDFKAEPEEKPPVEVPIQENPIQENEKCCDIGINAKYLYERSRSLAGIKKAPIDYGNDDFKDSMRQNRDARDTFQYGMTEIFSEQLNNFIETGMSEAGLWDDDSEGKLDKIATEFVREVMGRSGQDELNRISPDVDLRFDFISPEIDQALRNYTDQLTKTLRTGTERDVRRKIDSGIRNGLSTDEIADSIEDLLRKEPKTGIVPIEARAEMIARTETSLIHEQAKYEAWRESGIVTMKQWQISSGACDSCKAMGRKFGKPIPLEDPFLKIDDVIGKITVWAPTPEGLMHAPLHPNCRCGTIEIFNDEVDVDYLKVIAEETRQEQEKLRKEYEKYISQGYEHEEAMDLASSILG